MAVLLKKQCLLIKSLIFQPLLVGSSIFPTASSKKIGGMNLIRNADFNKDVVINGTVNNSWKGNGYTIETIDKSTHKA